VREGRGAAGETGQATIEWTGLLLLVSLLTVGLLAVAGARVPATDLARAIAAKLVCAVRLSDACSAHSQLVAAYGPELAAQIAAWAPEIVYEDGMTALPVDFRACRGRGCGNGAESGAVWASDTGQPKQDAISRGVYIAGRIPLGYEKNDPHWRSPISTIERSTCCSIRSSGAGWPPISNCAIQPVTNGSPISLPPW
jgi:hypothetical protein